LIDSSNSFAAADIDRYRYLPLAPECSSEQATSML